MNKILVACGTGIATSTVLTLKIKEALSNAGIEADVVQCKVSEIDSKLKDTKLIVTTTNYNHDEIPVLRAISFLTGIGVDKDIEKIIEIMKK